MILSDHGVELDIRYNRDLARALKLGREQTKIGAANIIMKSYRKVVK